MTIRELSVGSYVQVNLGRYGLLTGMVGEINSRQLGIFVIEKILVPDFIRRFVVGSFTISSFSVLKASSLMTFV